MNATHQDPTIYANPTKWDPGRYAADRAEDKKKPYAYLGWGAGRHPCREFISPFFFSKIKFPQNDWHHSLYTYTCGEIVGMRFAKLEQNIIVAFFITMFDYDLCDRKGNIVSTPTPIDLNAFAASKPNPKVYLKYRLRNNS